MNASDTKAPPMKQLSVRKVGPVRLTSAAAAFYGNPVTCPPTGPIFG